MASALIEDTGTVVENIAGMDGIARIFSSVRRRNLLHGWVQFKHSIGPRPDHWVELRWIPAPHILRYLRSKGPAMTRVLLDLVRIEVSMPFIATPAEAERDFTSIVLEPGVQGYVYDPQVSVQITLQPTEDERAFFNFWETHYLHYVAEQVTIAARSLHLDGT